MTDWNAFPRNTWVEIDLKALANNFKLFQREVGTNVLTVVKANGYGHGIAQVSKCFADAGASMLGVATVSEAAAIREARVTIPILLMSAYDPAEAKAALALDTDVVVSNIAEIEALAQQACTEKKTARAHLEIDTGMSRLGCKPSEAIDILINAARIADVKIVGMNTHFWGADMDDMAGAYAQENAFAEVVDGARGAGVLPPIVHAANSPASLRLTGSRYQMVRGGIALYGYEPDVGVKLPPGMKPVLSWRGRIAMVRELPAGEGVGYGHEYVAPSDSLIAVLPAGYADGFRRAPKGVNRVLIAGKELRVVGRVCMDQCFALLENVEAKAGDPFTLLGEQDGKRIRVEDIAVRWGTNIYDVIACISPRVPRRYV